MKAKGILLTVVVILALLFAVINWGVLFALVPVNLLLATVQVPLGAVLVGIVLLVSLLFFLFSLFERANQLRQVTHQERVIEDLQARLDKQRSQEIIALESSLRDRFDEVRRQLEADTGRVEGNLQQSLVSLEERQSERVAELLERVVVVRDELSADIGELENRLESNLRLPASPES